MNKNIFVENHETLGALTDTLNKSRDMYPDADTVCLMAANDITQHDCTLYGMDYPQAFIDGVREVCDGGALNDAVQAYIAYINDVVM